VTKYQNNINYKNRDKSKKSKKNEDSLMKEMDDVMSSDSENTVHSSPMSGADPDL